ncbi:serpin family protein [Catellatospora sichuanensis]|uniref:serpin family protein n=1 Tax=Catellatospora sichuanensis TaxID=1969805 RepID=UPI001182EF81|nr:serpin family protein [Catellatospora sichuanensis]
MIETAVAGANAVTRRWVATIESEASAAVSGAGVWPLLAYLAPAADGDGRDELTAAIGLPADEAVAGAAALVALLQSAPGLRAALGTWVRPWLELRTQWRDSLPPGTVGVLGEQEALDAWVREQTDGLLDRLPLTVDPDTLLILASALVARTRWKDPFDDGRLVPTAGPWLGQHLAGLHRTTADRDLLAVYETPAGPVTVLTVEGTDGIDVDLAIGLPDTPAAAVLAAGIDAPSAVPGRLGSQFAEGDTAPGVTVGTGWAYDDTSRLRASVPRFTVTSSHDLLAHADVFGLRTVSDLSRQRLPGVSDFPLGVGAAAQDLTASFTADGFEAAVVTAFGMRAGGAMPARNPLEVRLLLDRPFGFVARHRPSGLVLVAGWVAQGEPSAGPGFGAAG